MSSGAITDTTTRPYWIGVCEECDSVKRFDTERERDLWQLFHAHQENS